MPSSVNALLIVIFSIVPGFPGEKIYQHIVGLELREKDWQRITRMIAFSLGGIALYTIGNWILGQPLPSYSFTTDIYQQKAWLSTSGTLVGHTLCATLVGGIAAYISRSLNRLLPSTCNDDAWHEFVRSSTQNHWIIVSLRNGDRYLGMLKRANTPINRDERDIVLEEPAKLDQGRYIGLPYQHMFLPGAMISAVATLYDPEIDRRTYPIQDSDFVPEFRIDAPAREENGDVNREAI